MSVHDILTFVDRSAAELRVFNVPADDPLLTELERFLEPLNASLERTTTASHRPAGLAVVTGVSGETTVTTTETLAALVSAGGTATGVGGDDREFTAILEPLKQTTFHADELATLEGAAREVVDRAARYGEGSMLVATPEWAPAITAGGQLEQVDTVGPGLVVSRRQPDADCWAVAFDGGRTDEYACGVLAVRTEDGYRGITTYDPGLVSWLCSELSAKPVVRSPIASE